MAAVYDLYLERVARQGEYNEDSANELVELGCAKEMGS